MSIVARKKKGLVLFFSFWAVLFFLIWRKILVLEPNGLYAGWINVWGDWAAHLSYVGSFAYRNNWPPKMPLLVGAKFSYPFVANLIPAGLIRLGLGMVLAMLIPSFILSMTLVFVLWWLGKELTKSVRVGKLTTMFFLLNGGLGFWWWIKDVINQGFFKVMSDLPQEYTHLENVANIQWINMITSQVIPQRGFLLGFTIAVVVYGLLWRYFSKGKVKALKIGGVITALLPLIHAHSFVVICWVGFWLMVIDVYNRVQPSLVKTRVNIPTLCRNLLRRLHPWVWFFAPIVIIGLPQLVYFYNSSLSSSGFIRFKFGWMKYKDESNFVWFWLKNLGLSLGLMILGFFMAEKKLKWFSLPFWGLFVIANLWIFQPWEWDNTKLLTHWYLIASVLGAITINKWWKQKYKIAKGLVMIILGLTLLSGWLDVLRMMQYKKRRIQFFGNDELKLAEWVKTSSEKDSVFLTSSNHDHWVPVLTGRQIVLGFKGWLWTYGMDYSKQEVAVRKIYEGDDEAGELIDLWGVDYAVVGPMEKGEFKKLDEEFFEDNFEVAFRDNFTKIYKLN
ncbi:hypothetical protein ACFL18_01950 [Patescibacteria group bacterium]